MYRWFMIELYTWNLYDLINQCHPNKIKKNKLSSKPDVADREEQF